MVETIETMSKRHKQESRDLEGKIRALLKTAKKSNKAIIDAEAINMGLELKSRHIEEYDLISEFNALDIEDTNKFDEPAIIPSGEQDENEEDLKRKEEEDIILAKKAKSQKKKANKSSKEAERQQKKEEIHSSSGPSLREIELHRIIELLLKEELTVKLIASDGHCLYRSVADQLDSLWLLESEGKDKTVDVNKHDFISLRLLAGSYLRENSEEFAPFLGLLPSDLEYELYCRKIESVSEAEWGGQLEIRALCACLNRSIYIYSADSPVLKMGEENDLQYSHNKPLKLAYHRHFYALGEHYNSVEPIAKPCGCESH